MNTSLIYRGEVTLDFNSKKKTYQVHNAGKSPLFKLFTLLLYDISQIQDDDLPYFINLYGTSASDASFSLAQQCIMNKLVAQKSYYINNTAGVDISDETFTNVMQANLLYTNLVNIDHNDRFCLALESKSNKILALSQEISKTDLQKITPGTNALITWKLSVSNSQKE